MSDAHIAEQIAQAIADARRDHADSGFPPAWYSGMDKAARIARSFATKPDPMDLDNLGVDFTPNERAAIRIRFGMLGPKHNGGKQ